jgi:hypothetical protein
MVKRLPRDFHQMMNLWPVTVALHACLKIPYILPDPIISNSPFSCVYVPRILDLRVEKKRLSGKAVSLRNRYLLDISYLISRSLTKSGDVQIEALARELDFKEN